MLDSRLDFLLPYVIRGFPHSGSLLATINFSLIPFFDAAFKEKSVTLHHVYPNSTKEERQGEETNG